MYGARWTTTLTASSASAATSEDTASGGTPWTALLRTAHERTSESEHERPRAAPGARPRSSSAIVEVIAERSERRDGRKRYGREQRVERERVSPLASAMPASTTRGPEESDVPRGHSFALGPDDPSMLSPDNSRREKEKGMATLTWLGHSAFRLDTEQRQADLRRPVPDREPEDARGGEGARARRRDRDHARPQRPRRRRGRALPAVPRRADRLPGRAEELAGRQGRERRPAAGAEQGRHGRDRRCPLHARQRLSFVELRRGRVPRRGLRHRRPARERHHDLLRRRHLPLRRHAADPPAVRARLRRAADRRPLHDGPERRRDRARPARQPALHPLPLGDVPAPHRHARAAAGGGAGAVVHEIEPGDTIELD